MTNRSKRLWFHAVWWSAAMLGMLYFASSDLSRRPIDQTTDAASAELNDADEVVVMIVVSRTCTFSRDEDLPALFSEVVDSLKTMTSDHALQLVTSGVAIDAQSDAGLAFLDRFGPLAEVASGGGWANGTILELAGTGPGILRSTPQVIILRRAYSWTSHGDASRLNDVDIHVLTRLIGHNEISWLLDREYAGPLLLSSIAQEG